EGAQMIRRRADFLELDRIGRPDIDEGLALAVADAVEAEFVDLDCRPRQARLRRPELRLESLAGWAGDGRLRQAVLQALTLDGQRLAASARPDRFLFELRLLHQPVGETA